jgi:hypothetical protein
MGQIIQRERETKKEKKKTKKICLFVEHNNCDVTFSFEDDQQISAHKKILWAISPVFAAMFKHNKLEAKTRKSSKTWTTMPDLPIDFRPGAHDTED